jgi:cellulose/xylan binding protein with CBM9 domain
VNLRRLLAACVGVASMHFTTPSVSLQTPAPPHPRGYVAFRAGQSPTIDGRVDDSVWLAAPWSETFMDIEGDRQPRPRFETRVKMLWDADYFYVGAELRDPHVWGSLTTHDAVIFHDPDFEVFIDPNGDNHEYYEFEINALGTFWDLFLPKPYKDDGKAMNAWEIPGLKSAVFVDGTLNDARDTDRGWSVEIAFPWRVLAEQARRPAPPGEGDQWRVNFSRVQWPFDTTTGRYVKPKDAREDNWVWSPQFVVDMHRPELWGYVQFTSRAPGEVTFVPDRSWPARTWLHRAYYAQREYRKAHGRFAMTIDDLKLGAPGPELSEPTLQTAGSVFEAHVRLHGTGERWHIRQDALVWRD